MKRIIPILILLITTILGGLGYWMYNKKPESLKKAVPAFTIKASELLEQYSKDETHSDEMYQGQIILVKGTLKDIQNLTDSTAILVLGEEGATFGVSCSLDRNEIPALKKVNIGESMSIKGECTGYLMDVNLVRCVML